MDDGKGSGQPEKEGQAHQSRPRREPSEGERGAYARLFAEAKRIRQRAQAIALVSAQFEEAGADEQSAEYVARTTEAVKEGTERIFEALQAIRREIQRF